MPAPFVEGAPRQAIRHLFNSDPDAGEAALRGHLRERPNDPLAYALLAAVRFYHYASQRVPQRDTGSIVWQVIGPGIAMSSRMQKEIGDTLKRAKALARGSTDANALLALCIVEAVNRDGLALVSKSWAASLAHAERAHELAAKLIACEPTAHDAYFILGSTEYLLSRVPPGVRSFVSFRGVCGDRKKAIGMCQTAAKSGWFFQEFARRLLVNLYMDEGRVSEAVKLLADLADEFPANPLLREDLMILKRKAQAKGNVK